MRTEDMPGYSDAPDPSKRPGGALDGNGTDFRIIPFGFVALYVTLLLFSEFHLGSYAVIGKYFQIDPKPYFVDLRVLLSGIDAIREGMDPYTVACLDGKPHFNYPYIWGVLSLLPFFTVSNLLHIGFGMALLLFGGLYSYVGRLGLFDSIAYTLIFLAPAVMLGVERGNCDLMVFLLLLIPLLCGNSRTFVASMILLTGMLKLFPIGAVGCLLGKGEARRGSSLWLPMGVVVTFLTYLILMKENIILVSQKTPRPAGRLSYGLGAIPSMITSRFPKHATLIAAAFGVFLLAVLGLVVSFRFVREELGTMTIDTGRKGMSYVIGSAIFLTTCVIGFNWEYRLIFLSLTMPQTLKWLAEGKLAAYGLLVLTILILWQSFIGAQLPLIGIRSGYYYALSELLVSILFCCHLAVLPNFLLDVYQRVGAPKGGR